MRMWIPESPRWLAIHGREKEGEDVVKGIEKRFEDEGAKLDPVPADKAIRLRSRDHTPLSEVFDTLINRHRVQTFVGLTLMGAQAFFYNAIFFTYALVLTKFYSVGSGSVGWYILPFALSNFLGPVVLGRLFDTLGRRIMITVTYGLSGVLMIAVAVAFQQDLLSAMGQTIGWMIVFFIASPAASAAYLTVSETFPIEIRAMAIAHLLRDRNRGRRRRRAADIWQAHRKRVAGQHLWRLCFRCASDVRSRFRRRALRHQRRA